MRNRNRRSPYITVGASLLLTFSVGAAILTAGDGTQDKSSQYTAPTLSLVEPTNSHSELWGSAAPQATTYLLDIGLDQETQWAIYNECGGDGGLFCTAMAIANLETGGTFQTDAVGDNGDSIGLFQVNTRWHEDRMERLGVTDLTDPTQCAAVAIDYLKELSDRYGFEPESEALLMAYNMGPGGASNAIEAGITSTDYSQRGWVLYQDYLEELEGRPG